jgi:hypothetical protein
VRPADSSVNAAFISSIASGIGTSSRIWLRVKTSIRRAPLSTSSVSLLLRSPSLARQAVSHIGAGLTHANEIQGSRTAFTPVLYMPVGMEADDPR